MMKTSLRNLFLALSLLPLAAPLSANTLNELTLRQNEMRQDMRALEERFRRIESQMSTQGLLNLLNQLAELKAEMARLRGQQEELQNTLLLIQRRQKDLYEDLDNRIRELANRPQPVTSAVPATESIQLQPSRTLLSGGDVQSESRSYEAALAQFRAGDYAAAARGFQAFLRDYPRGSLASNALYWLGLALATLGNYPAAVESYQRLLNEFPNSTKVPDAMLSLARAHIQMGETVAAQTLLDQLVARFPQARAAESARKMLATLK